MKENKLIPKPHKPVVDFFQRYLDQVPDDGMLLDHLQEILADTIELIKSLPPEKFLYRYEPDKWTLKDILVHMIDTERIFIYRALRFGRNDLTPLPGFEQDPYVEFAGANDREVDDILEEMSLCRASSICFIKTLDESAWPRTGKANGRDMSVLALINLVYGHHKHHWNIMHELYL